MTEIRRLSTGINQSRVRAHNERLILTMLQRAGPLAGRDIARLSGLSPQTASVILRKLESDALIRKGKPQRGKVGKPSVPFRLAPDGLFSLGLKIGRRGADLLLLDFTGTPRVQYRLSYPYPVPGRVFDFLQDGLEKAMAEIDPDHRRRICGIGIAAPFELWNWHDLVGAPKEEFAAWKHVDFAARIRPFSDLPVHVVNDATAACRAELYFGRGKHYRNFAHFFLGAFIGGGVVMNHSVVEGQFGNAGAFGSLPARDADGRPGRLIDIASIRNLERAVEAAGGDTKTLWDMPRNWQPIERQVAPWIDTTAAALAEASLSVCAVVDFEAVLIDGAMPQAIRRRLVDRMQSVIGRLDSRGLVVPGIEEGRVGQNARALGAAVGPIINDVLLADIPGLFAPSSNRPG
ncbi:MAG: ROK family transcriptional regulator [Marinibacterium sp.]